MADIFTSTSRLIYKVGGFKVNTSNPYVLTGGTLSVLYVNNRLFQNRPDEWHEVIPNIITVINSEVGYESVGFISGGESADFSFSYPVAYLMHKPHIAIRKGEAGHGLGGRLIGEVDKNPLTPKKRKAVHVADLITDGGSAVEWVNVLRYEGADIADYITVFDRIQGGRSALNTVGVRLHTLSEMNENFFDVGINLGVLTREQYINEVKPYLADSIEWGKSFVRKNPDYVLKRIKVDPSGKVDRESLKVFLKGYPDIIEEFRSRVNERLRSLGAREEVLEFGYNP